jgi:hypothetical protein
MEWQPSEGKSRPKQSINLAMGMLLPVDIQVNEHMTT